jgi:bacterioferritin-associated ferredoxin
MYICICKGVTDTAIREAVCHGAKRMKDLKECLGVSTQCGICAAYAQEVLDQELMKHSIKEERTFI